MAYVEIQKNMRYFVNHINLFSIILVVNAKINLINVQKHQVTFRIVIKHFFSINNILRIIH